MPSWLQRPGAETGDPPKVSATAAELVAPSMNDETTYLCDHCGEEIIVPVDLSAGSAQEYVEDCPVCCNPNVIHVAIEEDGNVRAWGEAEQDR